MRSELLVECREIVWGRAKDSTCALEKPAAGQISKSRKPAKQIVFLKYQNLANLKTNSSSFR